MLTKKINVTTPKYQMIAVDLASKIADQKLLIGDKIHARSTLANQYGVSPETARKAVSVLVDLEIVQAKHGSGFFVSSIDKAREFVTQYKDVLSLRELKGELIESIQKQKEELNYFSDILDTFVEQTKRFDTINPLHPVSFTLTEEATHLEMTVGDMNLWQNTSATLVAIKHCDELIVSPGPYTKISVDDTIYFVGNESTLQRVQNFFYPQSG
ncbi:GntR family transcriptional regulator [Melissococcus plutonius]|uniref:Transcriptional regulator, GntR family n=1 Tax=Melissococcus plutonius TaxID=33970 RepID=A0A2Z5Y1I6_9ENTE|nr:GntR family transcriptional regulator [Melissococcus plutonius]BAL61733.1 GntR family transcriptional regulator [Melissococcus plutonius DAT561]MCV2498322.1 GntR family transcriptional regulator [Melissococcus plutonius]MCV2500813.1 GntR family transcriptional regulator [Melissococcus plutonius]MCV2504567.1 GntR family transcriptional regulator [Melissococcus plutonius]MCV2506937.1 GntR family transcriptional regulator [Melissococcus plutonius]